MILFKQPLHHQHRNHLHHSLALFDVLFIISFFLSALKMNSAITFDVIKYGAKGDGISDDSQAFLRAWEATCEAREGIPTLKVPSGRTFYLKPLVFKGPCKSSPIRVQVDGTLIAPSSKSEWQNCHGNTWIVFQYVIGLKLEGTGTLDGKGSVWWGNYEGDDSVSVISDGGQCYKPTTFRLNYCPSSQIKGLHYLNSGGNHISIGTCDDLKIFKIKITAPEESHNTDGINIFNSKHVQIHDSFIGTGDDCIGISNLNSNFDISNIICGPGHGISVGSLGGSNIAVDGIYVRNCTFIRTLAAARIKTKPGASGYARNIHYDQIILDSVYSGIEINQHYSAHTRRQSNAVQLSDIHFTNVQGTAQKIMLDCSPNAPCNNIVLQQVNLTSSNITGREVEVTCQNAHVRKSEVTPPLPC